MIHIDNLTIVDYWYIEKIYSKKGKHFIKLINHKHPDELTEKGYNELMDLMFWDISIPSLFGGSNLPVTPENILLKFKEKVKKDYNNGRISKEKYNLIKNKYLKIVKDYKTNWIKADNKK